MIKNKRILVVTTTDNMIWQFLIPHIQHLQKAGNTVECACNESGFWFKELEEKYGFVMHKINFTRFPFTYKNIIARRDLFKLQKEGKYDLVSCHQPVGEVMGRMFAKKYKIPAVCVAHGFHFFKGAPLRKNLIYKTVERHYAKCTDALVVMNKEDYDAATKFKAKKLYFIHGIGLDPKKLDVAKDFNRNSFRTQIGLEKDDIAVLTVAEFIKRKNYDTMLKAIACTKNEHIKFLICGRGKLEQEIKNQIAELKIENKVKLLGYRKDISEIMHSSDIFMLCSHQEGLTLSIIEAMGNELPVVTSNVRGNQDLIENEKGGFVCEQNNSKQIAECLDILANDKEKRIQFGKYNKVESEKYTIEKVLKEMEKIYDEIKF